MDENFYIIGLQEGDERIFRKLFERYYPRLCYFASSLLPFSESEEDVVQEAFEKLWQKRMNFYNLKAVKTFLYITVKNRCLNIHKHGKVVKKHADRRQEETIEAHTIMDHLLEAEVLEKVNGALQRLPPGCRSVLHLSYFEGLKNKEVAAQLKVSINTVKTQKQRGLSLLRAILKVSSIFF